MPIRVKVMGIADCLRERSDNDWPGKAPFLHSHVSTPQQLAAIPGDRISNGIK